ncbi:MAG: aldo/keto reductase [Planctomycetaceae bacterium]|nr:aldo/keto reductase [Planctomycetaceae bacterium]
MSFSRRGFLSGVSAAALSASLLRRTVAQEATKELKPLPRVKIGKTGIETTLLGVGTGTRGGSDFLNMGQSKFVEVMLHAFQNGIRYIDTAENYRTHIFMRFALQEAAKAGIQREDFFLLTKSFARTAGAAKVVVDRYLYEMECKYIDTLLMHCLSNGDWPKVHEDVWDTFREFRKSGRVKSIGVSCHTFEALEATLTVEDIDVVLVRINPFGVNMDATPDKVVPVIQKLHDRGVGILGMKIYGEGKFTEKQERYDSLKYVMNLGCVDAMTIGFTEKAHVDETLQMVSEIQG